jgi:uncharacterized membrane protein YesL
MNGFFGLDSKFYKYGTLLGDIMILTLLWTITSLPLITIGASTTALYYVTTRQLSNREGYVTKDFFRSFKQNFFEATGVTILFAVIFAVLGFNIRYLDADSKWFLVQFVLIAVAIAVLVFVFPILSRFKMGIFSLLGTSFSMAIGHFPTTITCLALLYAIYMIVMRWPILFVVCVGFYGLLTSLMFMRIFKKHLPLMDTDEYDEMKRNGETEDATDAENES